MEITFIDFVLFVIGFGFLFFVPGYNLLRTIGKKGVAESFIVSSIIVLVESLGLTMLGQLNTVMLLLVIGVTIVLTSKEITSVFRSASP